MLLACRQQLLQNSCDNAACTLIHDLSSYCRLCSTFLQSRDLLRDHVCAKKHSTPHRAPKSRERLLANADHALHVAIKKKEIARPALSSSSSILCASCNSLFPNKEEFQIHTSGDSHKARVDQVRQANSAGRRVQSLPPNYRSCPLCNILIRLQDWDAHTVDPRHQRNEQNVTFRENTLATERPQQHELVVSHLDGGVDFGIIEARDLTPDTALAITVTAALKGQGCIHFERAGFTPPNTTRRFEVEGQNNVYIADQAMVNIVTVKFKPFEKRGRYQNRIELHFRDTRSNTRFTVTRPLRATVGLQADLTALEPVAPFAGNAKTHRIGYDPSSILMGDRPEPLNTIPSVYAFPEYPIPSYISKLLESGGTKKKSDQLRKRYFAQPPSADNHGRLWSILLHVEEHQMERPHQIRYVRGSTSLSQRSSVPSRPRSCGAEAVSDEWRRYQSHFGHRNGIWWGRTRC
ncbi:hypothetical protein BOTBODRAFT_244450 [Botryobasidium botryosum FD-172 SS1]|uniref:C2H2-type domain-containing protein n=1 Tax=Botryobasidium botryosum (strain FD-172 SS1) TaxID=930990 RepID=A0A067M4A7_BOTB1|nr:hypothetical protein BOTBODRAFT_244450 [Botryobasidium botryosum FD-172 SS1]